MAKEEKNEDVWNEGNVLDIIEHFRHSPLPVTADTLKAYCDLKKYKVMVPSQYEDFLFSIEHNEKKEKVLAAIVKLMLGVKITPEVGTDKQKEAVLEANYAIEREILEVVKNEGVLFREADLMLDSIASAFTSIFTGTRNRINNMSARQMQLMAQFVLDKGEIVLKELSDWKDPKIAGAEKESA